MIPGVSTDFYGCYLIKKKILFYRIDYNIIEISDISDFQLQKIKNINLKNRIQIKEIFKANKEFIGLLGEKSIYLMNYITEKMNFKFNVEEYP